MNEDTDTLGARLAALRESSGLSVDALARVISISPAHIRALENNDLKAFGAKVYARGVLKKILSVTEPGDTRGLMAALNRAWSPDGAREREGAKVNQRTRRSKMWYLTPTRIGLAAVILFLIVFISFAGARIIRYSAPPLLVIDEPRDKITLRDPVVMVKGRTERESKLTVNGRELTIDDSGNFKEQIELQRGVTRLDFLSENRFGKRSEVTRYVVVE